MTGDFSNATIDNLQELLDYENTQLKKIYETEIEQSLARWNSRWRPESLDHYLKSGWSFILRDRSRTHSNAPDGELIGYFLAQPLLFLDGQTQSLWVEHISYNNIIARDQLCDFAYRLSREKHFQKVYIPSVHLQDRSDLSYAPREWNPEVIQVLTTKVQYKD